MNESRKNLIIAAVLSLLFVAAWDYFYAFPQMDRARQNAVEQAKLAASPKLGAPEKRLGSATDVAGRVEAAIPKVKTRDAALAESPRVSIDTKSVFGSIALKGARLDDVSFKKYREKVDPTSPNIVLFSPEDAPGAYYTELGYLSGDTESPPVLPSSETLWTADAEKLTASRPVTLSYDNGHGLLFKRKISIDDEYMFTIEDSVENKTEKPVVLYEHGTITRVGTPQGSGYAILHEGFIGVVGDSGVQEVTYEKIEKEPHAQKGFKGVGGWVGFTDKYWGAVIAPDQKAPFEARFAGSGIKLKTYDVETVGEPKTIAPGAATSTNMLVFAGAKEVDTIDAYQASTGLKQFDLLIDWGWFYFITRPMFRLIDFLYKILGNFGLAILAVTVIVKLAFLPLANKSYKSMAKMKAVQPKIKELKEKYADDKHKLNMEQMELFKREKINPAAGCLPVLFQIPVFFSLYKVLVATIEMRQAPFFGWIKDLSAPDPTNVFNLFGLLPFDPTHIPTFGPYLALGFWPLLMGVSMWLQMKMNPEPTDDIQKMMFTWMPLMFTFTMGGFASGLIIYWTWNNTLSVAQQWVIMSRAGVKFELWDNLRKTFGFA